MRYKNLCQVFVLSLMVGCSQRDEISDFSNYLGVNLPNDMNRVKYNSNANLQDYSNSILFSLSNLQRNNLISEISSKLCDSTRKDCWKKYGDYYSFDISDSTLNSGYYIKALLTNNSYNALIIKELKWK